MKFDLCWHAPHQRKQGGFVLRALRFRGLFAVRRSYFHLWLELFLKWIRRETQERLDSEWSRLHIHFYWVAVISCMKLLFLFFYCMKKLDLCEATAAVHTQDNVGHVLCHTIAFFFLLFFFFFFQAVWLQHLHPQKQAEQRRQASPLLARRVYESHKWLFNIVVIRVVIWVELSLIVARHASATAANTHAFKHTHTNWGRQGVQGIIHTTCQQTGRLCFFCVWAFLVCVYLYVCVCVFALRLWSSSKMGGGSKIFVEVLKCMCVCMCVP